MLQDALLSVGSVAAHARDAREIDD